MPSAEAASARPRVMVVDDHASMADALAEGLGEIGYDAVANSSSADAARQLESEPFDVLVTDLRMPNVDGLTLLALARKLDPDRPVIVMTAFSAVDSAIESIRQGAYHYLTKPFKVAELALFLAKALEGAHLRRETLTLRRALRGRFGLEGLVGRNEALQGVCDLVQRVADATAPVLILGETGTGKGLVARAIHAQGRRASGPFVTVNCAALPETLLESELFGHVKGAFTGATSNRTGLIEEASRGTLFLDEIAEMSPSLQAKLLHVLESATVRAVGANRERRVDTRIVTATHRDLRARVLDGSFREDLFYRLDVVTIEVPPLRHRRDDLPLLLEHFLAQSKLKHPSSPVQGLTPDALEKLRAHAWPGNVRELEHLVERAVLLGRDALIRASELPATIGARDGTAVFRGPVVRLREVQRRYAAWAYEELGGKKVLTAEKLDVDFRTLSKLLAPHSADGKDEDP
jgi:two-component system, NtrC family, response regulator HydG